MWKWSALVSRWFPILKFPITHRLWRALTVWIWTLPAVWPVTVFII
ncbi:hypothetical protein EVA_14941 [gut metagenome]|uniref:Uncharacterized protein n=1 Tax=gut metagenome TaxID=749906 RepID=J9G559_9ZZZZ